MINRRFNFILNNGTGLEIKPPTLRMYYKKLLAAGNDNELIVAIAEICNRNYNEIHIDKNYILDNFTVNDLHNFLIKLPEWIKSEIENDPLLKLPYLPENSENKAFLENNTADLKIVSDYTNLNFNEILELEIFEFRNYLHDAVIWNLSKSEKGREQLEKAYVIRKKDPDLTELRKISGGRHG